MKMRLLLCATFAARHVAVELRGTNKIEPELKDYPLSDKPGQSHDDFFDKDNPHDDRLGVHDDFPHKHPFPNVQSVSKYDSDYTKDENSDNGEWQAQMNYDVVRNKIRAKELLVKEAAQSEQTEEQQLADAQKTKEQAEADASKARAAAATAEQNAAAAHEKLERLAGKPGDQSDGTIISAREATERAMKHFADCEEELKEAKKALATFVEARDNATAEAAAAVAAAAAAGNSSNATNATDINQVVEEKKKDVDVARKALSDEESNVEDLHEKLKKAEEKLDEVRKIHSASARKGAYPGAGGGDDEPAPAPTTAAPKSAAFRSMGSAAGAVFLAVLVVSSA